MKLKTCFFFVLCYFFSFIACDNVELPPSETPEFCEDIEVPFYNTTVKPIIESSCAYAACHAAGGIGPGNYNSYEGLLNHLESGSFKNRVINIKDNEILGMPPNNSVYPESIRDDLTEEELEIMECWLDSGYPEG